MAGSAEPSSRDAELYAIARQVALEAFTSAPADFLRAAVGQDPVNKAVVINRLATQAAAAMVERTKSAQPYDGADLFAVVRGLVAMFAEMYGGTLEWVAVNARRTAARG